MVLQRYLSPFSALTAMRRALQQRQISARELLDLHLRRIFEFDESLNSVVVRDFDQARSAASQADEHLARGDARPLLGLPITIKESLDVEGLPSTAGVEWRRSHLAPRDSQTVKRLRDAGAVIIGKTNVCTWLADYNADNPLYGRTNNPWDLSRTCGGSSGGSAAVAAGLSSLDIGSDLGGSIRIPPAFCGLWGHRPSDSTVCSSGHFPGSEHPNVAVTMAAQGPQGRSAFDCELALDAMAGADTGMDLGWRLAFPPTRHKRLANFRVAVLPLQEWLPVDGEIFKHLGDLVAELRKLGVTVGETAPKSIGDLRSHYKLFRSMMGVVVSIHWPADLRAHVTERRRATGDEFHAADAEGFNASASTLLQWHEQREVYRAAWRSFFEEWDVLLTPMTLTTAFAHTTIPTVDRKLRIGGDDVSFDNMSFYPGLASLAGQPATAIPAGFSAAGLPIGLQAIGPFLEDRTTLRFAQLLEEEFGGFRPPLGYNGNSF